jgi:hypothetical protein
MHILLNILFAIATGITLSGLVANSYRLLVKQATSTSALIAQSAIMIFAGPVVLMGNAAQARKQKSCSVEDYGIALAVGGFWSFVTGLFFLAICFALRH